MSSNKWLALAFSFWVVVISQRYINTVVQGFRSPFNPGNDIEWFMIWLAAAVVLIVLAATVKRSVEIIFSILAVACTIALILSGTLAAALAAGVVFAAAHLIGCRLLRIFNVDSRDMALTIPIGLIALSLGGFVLAALHILTTLSIAGLLLCLTVAAIYGTRFKTLLRRSPYSRELRVPLLLTAPVIFLNFVWAIAPEIQFDALNYHLSVSQIYLRNHGFIDLQYFFHSYFYHLIEMIFTIALAFQGAPAVKLVSFGFSLIAALGVFSLGKQIFDDRVGAWAAAFFYTTPVVSWLSGTAYIDNAVAMLLTATAIAFLSWYRTKEQVNWLYVAALFAGATIAAKVNAAFALPVLFGVAVWHLRTKPRALAVCAALFLLVALPWFSLTYVWTGNPVFPLLNGVFKSPSWSIDNRVMDANNYGIGTSPRALLRLPFNLTWDSGKFGTATARGAAGIMLLLVIPFGFIWLHRRSKSAALLLTTSLLYLALWTFSFQNIRYYVHILPFICVLGVATVLHFTNRPWAGSIHRICCACVLAFQFPASSIQFWNIPDRFPMTVAFGMETRDDFLKRSLSRYTGAQYLNAVLKPDERVLGVDVEDARFYLNAPLETLSDATLRSALIPTRTMSGRTLFDTLRQSGFTYLFAARDSLKNPPAWYPYLQKEFLDQFATRIFIDENTVVYRLNR
jgi:hypothetical protein